MLARWALLSLLLVLPGVDAGLLANSPYRGELDYAPGIRADAPSFTFLSGRVQAQLADVTDPFGLFDVEPFSLSGIERICFTDRRAPGSTSPCWSSPTGALSIRSSDGGSIVLDFPKPASAHIGADHALGLFVDFSGDRDLQALSLGKSLVATSIDAVLQWDVIPSVSTTTSLPTQQDVTGGSAYGHWVGLNDATTTTVSDGVTSVAVPFGKPLLFQGRALRADTVHPGTWTVPFQSGSQATWHPASAADATAGLKLERLSGVIDQINGASSKGGAEDGFNAEGLDAIQPLLARVLNGAMMSLPTNAADAGSFLKGLGVVRFETLDAFSDGDRINLKGDSPLAIENGHVQGAQPLVGFGFVQLPWWSFVLWGLAIAGFVARLILRKRFPKSHPTWDQYRWVGIVVGLVAFAVLFWLWDMEVQSVWGTSLLSALGDGLSDQALLILAAIQLGPLGLVLFAVATPIGILLRSILQLCKQGTFMHLGGALSYVAAYPLGVTLMMSYLDYALQQAGA